MSRPTPDQRGERFDGVDFTGAVFRECTFTDVRIVGSILERVTISPFAGERVELTIDGVEVGAYVADELDRRFPERVQLRALREAGIDAHRAMWRALQDAWDDVLTPARALPEHVVQQSVGGEWSLVETLRHLLCATDIWLGRMVLGEQRHMHPLGLPPTDFDSALAASLGLDLTSQPSLEEVLAARAGHVERVTTMLDELTDDGLEALRTGEPMPGWGEMTRSVGQCLRVICNEESQHRRYARRDLDSLTSSPTS